MGEVKFVGDRSNIDKKGPLGLSPANFTSETSAENVIFEEVSEVIFGGGRPNFRIFSSPTNDNEHYTGYVLIQILPCVTLKLLMEPGTKRFAIYLATDCDTGLILWSM